MDSIIEIKKLIEIANNLSIYEFKERVKQREVLLEILELCSNNEDYLDIKLFANYGLLKSNYYYRSDYPESEKVNLDYAFEIKRLITPYLDTKKFTKESNYYGVELYPSYYIVQTVKQLIRCKYIPNESTIEEREAFLPFLDFAIQLYKENIEIFAPAINEYDPLVSCKVHILMELKRTEQAYETLFIHKKNRIWEARGVTKSEEYQAFLLTKGIKPKAVKVNPEMAKLFAFAKEKFYEAENPTWEFPQNYTEKFSQTSNLTLTEFEEKYPQIHIPS